jgi:hypothetical protein
MPCSIRIRGTCKKQKYEAYRFAKDLTQPTLLAGDIEVALSSIMYTTDEFRAGTNRRT